MGESTVHSGKNINISIIATIDDDHRDTLHAATAQRLCLWPRYFLSDTTHYGLVWWYTGVIDGYSSVFMWIPSKDIIIVAQVNHWRDSGDNFALLFPNQVFLENILNNVTWTLLNSEGVIREII